MRIARRRHARFVVLAAVVASALAIPVVGLAQTDPRGDRAPQTHPLCADNEPGVVSCGAGRDRRSPGGGDKVPHDNGLNTKKGQRATRRWPRLSGILWQVVDDSRTPYAKTGGPLNDELNGHHGSDTLRGGAGHDILWGDWDPRNNNTSQRDVLVGGAGNDWLYPSHGTTVVKAGPGSDYVWAYYGRGSVDCGPGDDTARIRTNGAFRTRGCEHIKHFCQHGENAQGLCLSPTGRPVRAARPTR